MSTPLFRKVDYTLSKLIHDIDLGEIGLPDIQRPFVWGTAKVRDLFDSMYKGFPVGYLLFWANGMADAVRHIGVNGKQKIPRLLIVDGQQRLTSLYAVLRGCPVLDKNYRERGVHRGMSVSQRRAIAQNGPFLQGGRSQGQSRSECKL